MERLIEYCKATTKEIESSFVLNFVRTELQQFNSRVDRAYTDALNLDRLTQESFTKMIPKDINNTQSCSGRGSGDAVDQLKSRGPILEFLKRHGINIRDSENNTKKEIELGRKRLGAAEYEEKDFCEDDDGHFIPRKLLLFKVETFKGGCNGRLGVRKSTKTFRAPVPNCTRSTAIEDLENERDRRHRVRKSTKTFRAPVPNCPRSGAVEDSWIGDNGSRQVIRKSTKTFRAPDPKSTRSTPTEHLEVPNTKPEEASPSIRRRVKKFFGFR